jgi:hypothetical protein
MFTLSPTDACVADGEALPYIAPTAPLPPAPTVGERARRDDTALAEVLQHPGIWRRRTGAAPSVPAQATGFAGLDAVLPGGGWPLGALSEILFDRDGLGECSLLLPVLATLTQARRRVVLIAPPYVPYAPALAAAGVDLAQLVHIDARDLDRHWTAEQCLRAGCCGAVISWMPRADYRQLRRLQLAAETGGTLGFVFRPLAAIHEASPAALRLRFEHTGDGPRIDLLKCRGRTGESQAFALRA